MPATATPLISVYCNTNISVTSTADDFAITGSNTALGSYVKAFPGSSYGIHMRLHSLILYVTNVSTAASVSVALTTPSENLITPAATCSIVAKTGTADAGSCVFVSGAPVPLGIGLITDADGTAYIRLATNAGTCTVDAIVMTFELGA